MILYFHIQNKVPNSNTSFPIPNAHQFPASQIAFADVRACSGMHLQCTHSDLALVRRVCGAWVLFVGGRWWSGCILVWT
jgi:hypothetical protein